MFTARSLTRGDGLTSEVDVNGRHTILTDEPETIGGSDLGPAPHELLPAMLASCVSTMIVLYARKRGWELGEVVVDVDYDTDTTPRRVVIATQLPDGLTEDQVRRLTRVAETCPVKRALEAGFDFEQTVGSAAGSAALSDRQPAPGAGAR